MQILTPDFSGRRPPPPPLLPSPLSPVPSLLSPLPSPLSPPHLPSPPPCLPPTFPPSLLPLRKFDSVLSSLFGMRLALRILRPHSLTLTLTVSLSHCLSHLSHLFLISLISLSPLFLSPLCLSSFRLSSLSSLSSLAGGSGQRATYKGLFTPASKKSAVFFPTSLPSTFPFWSASFRPPLGLKYIYIYIQIKLYIYICISFLYYGITHVHPISHFSAPGPWTPSRTPPPPRVRRARRCSGATGAPSSGSAASDGRRGWHGRQTWKAWKMDVGSSEVISGYVSDGYEDAG